MLRNADNVHGMACESGGRSLQVIQVFPIGEGGGKGENVLDYERHPTENTCPLQRKTSPGIVTLVRNPTSQINAFEIVVYRKLLIAFVATMIGSI